MYVPTYELHIRNTKNRHQQQKQSITLLIVADHLFMHSNFQTNNHTYHRRTLTHNSLFRTLCGCIIKKQSARYERVLYVFTFGYIAIVCTWYSIFCRIIVERICHVCTCTLYSSQSFIHKLNAINLSYIHFVGQTWNKSTINSAMNHKMCVSAPQIKKKWHEESIATNQKMQQQHQPHECRVGGMKMTKFENKLSLRTLSKTKRDRERESAGERSI